MKKQNKYDPLRDHMKFLEGNLWRTTFDEIEHIIGQRLPPSAFKHDAFWARQTEPKTHVWKKAWMDAGWEIDSFDRERRVATFRRML